MKVAITSLALLAVCAGQALAQQASAGFRAADLNDDGVVTRAEYDSALNEGFARVDTDRDGQFSLAERLAVGGGPAGGGAPDPDANADGVVTRAEYDAFHGARFIRLDLNRDGRLLASESSGAPR